MYPQHPPAPAALAKQPQPAASKSPAAAAAASEGSSSRLDAGGEIVDCGECEACIDKPKFGGPGLKHKACALKAMGRNGRRPAGGAKARSGGAAARSKQEAAARRKERKASSAKASQPHRVVASLSLEASGAGCSSSGGGGDLSSSGSSNATMREGSSGGGSSGDGGCCGDGVYVRLDLSTAAVDKAAFNDCGKCEACLDKVKFGGPGRLRKACLRKPGGTRQRRDGGGLDRTLSTTLSHHQDSGQPLMLGNHRLRSRALPVGGREIPAVCRQPSFLEVIEFSTVDTKYVQVGARFQACHPPLYTLAPRPPPAAPPLCACAKPLPCVWQRGRWWCAACDAISGEGGCGMELSPAPQAHASKRAPMCDCGVAASFRYQRWWCATEPKGCSFSCAYSPEPAEPIAGPAPRKAYVEAAKGTGALLTAAAYGPMNDFSFVAPSSGSLETPHGLGLHARVNLIERQAVCVFPEWVSNPLTLPMGAIHPLPLTMLGV